jgi:hypothetical protein
LRSIDAVADRRVAAAPAARPEPSRADRLDVYL